MQNPIFLSSLKNFLSKNLFFLGQVFIISFEKKMGEKLKKKKVL